MDVENLLASSRHLIFTSIISVSVIQNNNTHITLPNVRRLPAPPAERFFSAQNQLCHPRPLRVFEIYESASTAQQLSNIDFMLNSRCTELWGGKTAHTAVGELLACAWDAVYS
jgi:hypothetical protein